MNRKEDYRDMEKYHKAVRDSIGDITEKRHFYIRLIRGLRRKMHW